MTIHHPTDPALFSISTDFDAGLIRYKVTKLWDRETWHLYEEAVLAEMKKFHAAGRTVDVLGDVTEFPPQPQFLNDLRAKMIFAARDLGMRKCAVIGANAIVKMQMDRLSMNFYKFFTSEKEALDWLRQ